MSQKKYRVKLDDTERQQLEELRRGGRHGACQLTPGLKSSGVYRQSAARSSQR
jgi:hypothetical protein